MVYPGSSAKVQSPGQGAPYQTCHRDKSWPHHSQHAVSTNPSVKSLLCIMQHRNFNASLEIDRKDKITSNCVCGWSVFWFSPSLTAGGMSPYRSVCPAHWGPVSTDFLHVNAHPSHILMAVLWTRYTPPLFFFPFPSLLSFLLLWFLQIKKMKETCPQQKLQKASRSITGAPKPLPGDHRAVLLHWK